MCVKVCRLSRFSASIHLCILRSEKLEAWLAKKGKTPSRYRHMMCFGAHGHAGANSHGVSHGHGDGVPRGSVKRETKKPAGQRISFQDDVACSLFAVDFMSDVIRSFSSLSDIAHCQV